MQTDYDAIIVGAGPSGSTAAILLAHAGWSVALLEKQPFPRRKVCGECVAATNLPLLDLLGVGDAFASIAGPALRRVGLMCREQSVYAALPAARDAKHPWGRALGREHLDLLLLQRAAALGAAVLQPCTAQSLRGQPGSFCCEVMMPAGQGVATLRAPIVIAAHGSWQPLPMQRARWHCERRGSDLLGFKANFNNVRLETGLLPVLSFRGGYGGMVVADHGIATIACCIREDRLNMCRRASPGEKAGAVVEAYLQRECSGVRDALRGAVRLQPWLATGPIRPGVRLARGSAEIFSIGNAAGEAHPIIGEGISMALQSAWLLCEQLLRCRDILVPGAAGQARQREVQHRYAALWRAHFAARLRIAAAFAHLAMRPAIGARLLPLMRWLPGLLTHSARCSGKTRSATPVAAISVLAAGAKPAGTSRSSLRLGRTSSGA